MSFKKCILCVKNRYWVSDLKPSSFHLCMVQFDLLPSPEATPRTSPALRARGWGIV